MNPFPDARSVLVLDNCQIHHNDPIVELVRAAGEAFEPHKPSITLLLKYARLSYPLSTRIFSRSESD